MSSYEQANQLLEAFGKHIGQPGLSLGSAGQCIFRLADGRTVVAEYERSAALLILSGTVGRLLEDATTDLFRLLLQANYCWDSLSGITMAIEPATQTVHLMRRIPTDLELPAFLEHMHAFSAALIRWEEAIKDFQSSNHPAPVSSATPDAFSIRA